MQFKKRFLPILISFSLLVSGCSIIPTNADAAFEHFTLQLFQQDVASTTLGLHYTLKNPETYGVDTSTVTFGSFTSDQASTFAALENCRAMLDKFSYGALSKENQLTYDVLSSYLETAQKGAAYSLYEEPLSPTTGIHAQLPVLLAEYRFDSPKDVETYLKLIETLPEYFSSLIDFEQQKSDAGLFMSEETANDVLEQCNAFVSMDDSNYLLSTFEERLSSVKGLSSKEKSNYIAHNRQLLQSSILPAYKQLISALSKLKSTGKNTQGLCYLPKGKDYYTHLIARETGSARTIEDIITLIQSQISDDILAIQKTATENSISAEETSASISNSPDVILKELQEKICTAFPTPENTSVEIKYVPSALEPYLSPAFYLTPAIDNMEENVIYINKGQSMDDLHLFTTIAHEGYPGHLYQTTYYGNKNPNPLRTIFNFKGYVEGWATYAEMCSYYLSSLDKPAATLMQKNNSLILGLYAMTDIGIHYGGWNLERTIQFFNTYGIEDATVIQEIYKIIISDPANYLAYYVGYLEILDLKREVMKQEGDHFAQKDFHKHLLDVGPAPFEIVRKQLLGT